MNLRKFLKKERLLWHKHFIPSFLAAIVVAVIAFIYETTFSNIILLASVGASAVILTNSQSHHLTKLHTTIVAYIVAIVISAIVYFVNSLVKLDMALNVFLLIFLVGIFLFLFNAFHPPAITASISFIVLEMPLVEMFYLFGAVIILLIVVRFLTYIVSQHLPVKDFMNEFKRSF